MVMCRTSSRAPGFFRHIVWRRTSHKRHGQHADGFSLLEMLVALALVGLMSVLIVDVYGNLKTVRSLQEQTNLETNATAVANYIVNETSRALARPLLHTNAASILYLDGNPDVVRFVAITRTGFGLEELRQIEFSWQNLRGGLWRRSTLRRGDDELRKANVISEQIDAAFAKVSFQYLGAASSEGQWENFWQHSKMLPRAVKVSVSGKGPRGEFHTTAIARIF